MMHINTAAKFTAAGLAATLASNAMAAAADYSTLTSSVNWDSTATALMAVGVAVIAISVTFKGIKLVIRMVKGG